MVKYGKLYRDLQIKEFQGNYIDYKKLKQKIKKIKQMLPSTSQEIITKQRSIHTSSIKLNLRPSLSEDELSRNTTISTTIFDKYDAEFKEFKDLLDSEFQRCFKFFKTIKNQLHSKINKHLYTQTNYSSYNVDDVMKEIRNIKSTMYLAKCLNEFINDNMTAIKKILKKFDKKFCNYFGNLGPIYILDSLCLQNSDLEYLLQFKIIDETSCIIESNVKYLRDNFLELVATNGDDNNNVNLFFEIYNEILDYIKDIDQLIYFKIQYKEWFYFRKKDKLVSNKSDLLKNIMYNPILFSAYHKDDLMHKFLSRKDEIKEIEEIQLPLSFHNKVNIILIIMHTFFYNTLISGIYPMLFLIIRKIDLEHINYTFLIISSTYVSYYLSIMLYHYFGILRVKLAYTLSYILFFVGSLLYILSYQEDEGEKEENKYNKYKGYTIGILIASRVFIGLGTNPTMGKNYILTYSSNYYLPLISKFYVLSSILGHSFGPFFGFILYLNDDILKARILPYIFYTNYNCIGWYGLFFSFIFGCLHILFFMSPDSAQFHNLSTKSNKKNTEKVGGESLFLDDDYEDTQDKEFYKLQKKNKNKEALDIIMEEDNASNSSSKMNLKKDKKNMSQEAINDNSFDSNPFFLKSNTIQERGNKLDINIDDAKIETNPLFVYNENNQKENLVENNKNDGNFVNINMIPRTIEDLIRKEKTKFSYLNRNLLMIVTLLFFNNLLKENFIAYCSFYTAQNFRVSEYKILFEPKNFSLLISASYLLELLSMLFILPFYKLNTKIKELLIISMFLTIILMVPLLIKIDLFYYFIIISIIIIISSIIEVLSSCYLAYLTPPDWVFCQINAGALPLYIMAFGKLIGCLICLTSFSGIDSSLINNHVVIFLTLIGYGISGYFIYKSKNFRIKAIARIMRKTELESYVY